MEAGLLPVFLGYHECLFLDSLPWVPPSSCAQALLRLYSVLGSYLSFVWMCSPLGCLSLPLPMCNLFVLGVLLSLSTGNPSCLWLEEWFRDVALSLKHIRSLGSGSLGKCFTVCLSENRALLPQYLKAGLSAPHTCSYPHHESICLNLHTSDTWTTPCTHRPVTTTTKGKETLGGYQGHLCWKLYS